MEVLNSRTCLGGQTTLPYKRYTSVFETTWIMRLSNRTVRDDEKENLQRR